MSAHGFHVSRGLATGMAGSSRIDEDTKYQPPVKRSRRQLIKVEPKSLSESSQGSLPSLVAPPETLPNRKRLRFPDAEYGLCRHEDNDEEGSPERAIKRRKSDSPAIPKGAGTQDGIKQEPKESPSPLAYGIDDRRAPATPAIKNENESEREAPAVIFDEVQHPLDVGHVVQPPTSELARLRAENAEYRLRNAELNNLINERALNVAHASELMIELHTATKIADNQRECIARLKYRLDAAMREIDIRVATTLDLSHRLTTATQEHENRLSHIANLQQTLKMVVKVCEDQFARIADLERGLETATVENETQMSYVRDLVEENDTLTKENTALKFQLTESKDDIKSKGETVEELKEQIGALKRWGYGLGRPCGR
ncbi:hypothetical protein B0T14DRAFT_565624 [Immersiella caudata]|uniref:Uncharacterized protein n=1 Tax=Immersiella caudata TaxID=314043 RepID=A0AA39WZ69_9PEZI|nr:hypothetical protein B0T14DRAFT_565624 [Immersiella caudata]